MKEVLDSRMIAEEIGDLIKVGKGGNTFHDPKGRLLSRHQIETILANADFIKEENEKYLKVSLSHIDLNDDGINSSSSSNEQGFTGDGMGLLDLEDSQLGVDCAESVCDISAVRGADHDSGFDGTGYEQIEPESDEGDPEKYLDKWPTEEEARALQERNRRAELERSRERAFNSLAIDHRVEDIDPEIHERYKEALGNFVDAYAGASFKSADKSTGKVEKKNRLFDGVQLLAGKMFNTERHRRRVSFEQFNQVYIEARKAVIERHEEMFPASSFEDSRFNRLKIEQNMGDQILGLIDKKQAETARASAGSRKKGALSRLFGGRKARSGVVGSDREYNLGKLRSIVRGKIDFTYLTASYDKETGQKDPMDKYALALEAIDSISY